MSVEAGIPTASGPAEGFAMLSVIWKRRWLIVICGLVFGILGATYSLLVTPVFRAQVTLLPVLNKPGQGLMGQLGALGGLAGLAGINLEGGDKAEPMAVLNSKDFARSFIEDEKLLTVVLYDKWDEKTGKWKAQGGPDQPDIRDAVERFDKEIRRVGEDRKTGVITLIVDWKDPVEAAKWANMLAARINVQMRQRAIENADRSINYLRAELSTTKEVSLQQSISRLIESQMQTMMMARGNAEYAFRVVDEARVPKRRMFPKRALISIGCAMIGGFLACAWVVLLNPRPKPAA
jgi:uncharacterized protein involved in exopolysaccharide biosynthesis